MYKTDTRRNVGPERDSYTLSYSPKQNQKLEGLSASRDDREQKRGRSRPARAHHPRAAKACRARDPARTAGRARAAAARQLRTAQSPRRRARHGAARPPPPRSPSTPHFAIFLLGICYFICCLQHFIRGFRSLGEIKRGLVFTVLNCAGLRATASRCPQTSRTRACLTWPTRKGPWPGRGSEGTRSSPPSGLPSALPFSCHAPPPCYALLLLCPPSAMLSAPSALPCLPCSAPPPLPCSLPPSRPRGLAPAQGGVALPAAHLPYAVAGRVRATG